MNFEILYPGVYSMVRVELERGESIKAESGAMVSMSATIDVEGKLEGGILGGLARKFLTGETLFFQTLKAARGAGEVLLASAIPGDATIIDMDGSIEYCLQKDGFLAGSDSLVLETKAQNLAKGLFSGEGFFIQKIGGRGKLLISSFGSIHRIDLKPGETRIIDNGHLVAWPTTTSYSLEKASKSGWLSSLTSGEGFVCRFTGPGHVYIQTRNSSSFGAWIRRFIPAASS
ncbi:MAG: TIGR00266 family protein [Candidatus Wallbacteria bacterium HGW-Wallbacteria-1]|jgi:uncharacterized protein (TIGR00266 family)|uniref:TIGR00266 family protein n=1 Tax=Candidatus Wallbacteria bacterium HGW-Wallbacteria-1 TaxID=2013854 RepID=A0A2N1PN07_9BACT|nr:MAG: TIGR00266 family protein [Candidatus Wallbacteria bacterium HGW-Wallbacteria-1]